MKLKFLVFLAFSCLVGTLSAQRTSSTLDDILLKIEDFIEIDTEESDWFILQNESNTVYVDLAMLKTTATHLEIQNEQKEVVLKENLEQSPKDSIYELDLSQLKSGKYQLVIQTYQSPITKILEVK